jgi:hypothetical protein
MRQRRRHPEPIWANVCRFTLSRRQARSASCHVRLLRCVTQSLLPSVDGADVNSAASRQFRGGQVGPLAERSEQSGQSDADQKPASSTRGRSTTPRRHRPMVERSIAWLARGNRRLHHRGWPRTTPGCTTGPPRSTCAGCSPSGCGAWTGAGHWRRLVQRSPGRTACQARVPRRGGHQLPGAVPTVSGSTGVCATSARGAHGVLSTSLASTPSEREAPPTSRRPRAGHE